MRAFIGWRSPYEDADEDQIVYRDQGINPGEYKKAIYGDLM